MELVNGFRKLFGNENRRWVFLVAIVAITHLLFQSFLLPYGNALRSLWPGNEDSIENSKNVILRVKSFANSAMVRDPLTITINASDMSTGDVVFNVVLKDGNSSDSNVGGDVGNGSGIMVDHGELKNGLASEGMESDGRNKVAVHRNINDDHASENAEDLNEIAVLDDIIRDQDNFPLEDVVEPVHVVLANKLAENDASQKPKEFGLVNTTSETPTLESPMVSSLTMESTDDAGNGFTLEQVVKHGQEVSTGKLLENKTSPTPKELGHVNIASQSPTLASPVASLMVNKAYLRNSISNGGPSLQLTPMQSDHVPSKNNSPMIAKPERKRMKCEMPPKSVTTIDEMNRILLRHRRSSRAMKPRWSSVRDQEIIAARSLIENAAVIVNDQELYAPLFRNVSMFKRSYELMERILKVYVYKDGKKPIFHLPILKGLYASEGWFMKLMQGNKRFVVKDPRRAHLFYMPFSSRMLEYTIYVRNSHNRTNLSQYLKGYTEGIAAKYPYFNRTGGADHFLVACHDWAPYETRHHMEHCIKALCNADVTVGFKLGRDVSLPETYVRSARNPLRDLGGKPPSQRHILAFYAGSMHGYLRPILLKYWKEKDDDMKILGTMPPGVASKMNYIQYMKSSKYCICPKGYEVNSPRVVEAIFYECVPVIISDNFVPPLFEVLDWGAFSIILAEKDIPNLKDILLSIPKERYLALQLGVRKVQRHFLWHPRPEKYDLFHMTLHSIWYNRVYQIKLR
ncbi:probable glycosyltransferase At5g25310 [Durio zibethinus]|uniref:Probable glycosyltransferase At5g25310 n=1 Tax=Durio zibethinus TaxID=66656 RepID=A0A6P5XTW4_DURZI|nr:probable glycosyltransferase At5g25310 [Durio zibethinus]